ncbi:YdcF family protein [Xanthomonas massiliensis]|uniref:YdcF family protein n=1 Tax=Xanthomonas massiliensis TaxID=1720302 RepID=UPI0008252DD7
MTLSLVFLLALLAGVLAWRRWRRSALAAGGAAMALGLAVGCGPVPAWMLSGLQAGPGAGFAGWGRRNVIVLLGAGTVRTPAGVEPSLFAQGRLGAAARLWHACRQAPARVCRIEISGGDARGNGTSEAAVYRDALLGLGVAPADLLVEPASMNTWQNAQFSAPLLRREGADRVLLVSSATHLRRAQLYFAHFGIAAVPVRADWLDTAPGGLPSGANFMLADVALHEYLGIARYHLYQALGWNVEATRAGAL